MFLLKSLVDLEGVPDARPHPLQDPILSFSHTKSTRVGGPNVSMPPTGNPGSATENVHCSNDPTVPHNLTENAHLKLSISI